MLILLKKHKYQQANIQKYFSNQWNKIEYAICILQMLESVMWILLTIKTNINKQIYKNMFQINENIESGICYVDFAYHKKHISTSKKIEYAIWILQMLESVMWILQCHIVFFWISIKYFQICWPCIAIKSNFIFKN